MSDVRFRLEATIHRLVADQARLTPQATALVTDREELTYAELLTRARRLARFLAAKGVTVEEPVGVCLERSADLPVALLAVLLAGGCYLPLDPNYPRERIGFMLGDAKARWVITRRGFEPIFAGLAESAGLERIYLEEIADELVQELPEGERTLPEALAYLIYTSGSTGRPKGVAIRHRNATAFFGWCEVTYDAEEMSGVFAGTSICFDISIFEIFYTFSCGGTVILGRDALHLPSHPARDRVKLINTVPSAITELIRLKAIPPNVVTINLAGEPLKRALTDQVYATAPWTRKIYNLYGPSEDTTFSTWALILPESREEPTIGTVLDGSEGYILGPSGVEAPDGEVGELYLGGLGVSRGYLGRPRQTAERYLPDPFSGRPGDRIYKTGDRVRRRPDGLLECLGRFDFQVKIRGFRIELGEIEAALARHPAVEMPLALVREDVPGDLRVVAYFQLRAGAAEPSVAELRQHLADFLPHYMIPAGFVSLPRMPLSPNGKIDRAALMSMPPPSFAGPAGRPAASPRTPLEEQLLAIFAQLLQAPTIGIHDSFFELGGHSLLATRAAWRIEKELDLACPPRQLFDTPTVAGLAAVLEAVEAPVEAPIPRRDRGNEKLPVTAGQLGLFYVWLLAKQAPTYNIPVAVTLRGRLDAPALARSLFQLVARHQALRSRFELDDGLPVVRLEEPYPPLTSIEDLRGEAAPGEAAAAFVRVQAARPFDLLAERPLRLFLLRLAEEEHVLLVVHHHIVSDGVSLEIFFRELAELYLAEREDRAAQLPDPPIDIFDFAEWQASRSDVQAEPRLERWRRRLAGHRELGLPTDRPRPARSARQGELMQLPFPPNLEAAAEALARDRQSTFFMIASASFFAYAAELTGSRDLIVGTMRSGRNRPELAGLIGYFIHLLPIRVQLPAEPSFSDVLAAVQAAQLDAWSDEDVPFHRLAAELAPERQLARNPLIDVSFQVRPAYFESDFLPGLLAEPSPVHSGASKYDLEIAVVRRRNGATTVVEYDSELYDADSLASFFAGWHDFFAAALAAPEVPLGALARASALTPAASEPEVTTAPNADTPEPVEVRLHQLWCELLAQPAVDRDAHFFAIGGHSLLVARMVFRIRERFGVELPLEAVYEAPSLRLLAARLAADLQRSAITPPGLEPREVIAEPVLSFGEERLFFAHLVDPGSALYNLPLAVAIHGALDRDALERALLEIERRHEILRTIFVPTQGGVVPLLEAAALRLAELELPADGEERGLLALAEAEARRPFDLRRGPLWRAALGSDGQRHLLLVTFHHIVADGWSIDVFFKELSALYGAFSHRLPAPLPALPLQVREFAAWQRARFGELSGRMAERREQLAGLPRPQLPADFQPGEVFDTRGVFVARELPPPEVERLRAFAAAHDASLFQVALAAFFAYLAQHGGNTDVAAGIPSAGRERPETEPLIGFFVNTLVVRVDLGGDPDFVEILARTRHALLLAQKNVVPFEKLVEELNPPRDTSRPVLTPHFFQAFDGNLDLTLPGLECRMLEPWSGTAKFETDWALLERGGRFVAELEASAGLFRDSTAAGMLEGYLALIGHAVAAPATLLHRLGQKGTPELPTALAEETASEPASLTATETLRPARRDGLEKRLSTLWSGLLQTPHVGLDDNFFDLGGHSLLLPRLLLELEPSWPDLGVLDFFKNPTVRSLAAHLRTLPMTSASAEPAPAAAPTEPTTLPAGPPSDVPAADQGASPTAAPGATPAPERNDGIAIIGMSGRFPGAPDIETFWRSIDRGDESLRTFSEEELVAAGVPADRLADPQYVRAGAPVEGIGLFDPAFFGYSHREAELLDPQQRVFLECAWEALERSGHRPGGNVGVFAGAGQSGYLLRNLASRPELAPELTELSIATATDKDYLATRVAYKLDLRGPAITVQTACSTSLVAVHYACRSLVDGDCDLALAGGVTLQIPQQAGYQHLPGGILSPDGHCRPFDREAQGMVASSGAGVVALRRLADALADGDRIWAVIRASAINNDGAEKVGFTAPSSTGQQAVIEKALARSAFEPASVGYIECHGTATALGDAIEIAALRAAYREAAEPASIALGSLKSQVGHMDAAAGVGGLIRAVLAVHHGRVPPTLHFQEAHPALRLAESPFYVPPAAGPWPAGKSPRRAGVSSFGIGGTNAHVLLEETPAAPAAEPARDRQLLLLSAKSPAALADQGERLAQFLSSSEAPDLADAAYTLHRGRARFAHRLAVVAADLKEAAELLRGQGDPRQRYSGMPAAGRPVYFLFPGQGSQHPGMAAEIYRSEEVFRRELDACCEVLEGHLGSDLRRLIFAKGAEAAAHLQDTALAQPALFAVEWSLAALWRSWGIEPAGLLGHSVGEYVAAAVAEVFERDAALALIAGRAKLVASLPPGAMMALTLGEEELAPLLPPSLSLATINGPRDLVVSGPAAEIDAFAAALAQKNIAGRRLHTSHAFHSSDMEPALPALAELAAAARPRPPRLPYFANATGDWITTAAATSPQAWARHLREPVRFGAALEKLFENEEAILLEVGPSRALSALARRHDRLSGLETRQIVPSLPHARQEGGDLAALLGAVGQLWTLGVEVDETSFLAGRRRRRVVLPTYPFERRLCYLEPVAGSFALPAEPPAAIERPPEKPATVGPDSPAPAAAAGDVLLEEVLEIWREQLGGEVAPDSEFFDLGGHSLLALQLANRLRLRFGLELTIQDVLVGRGHTPRLQAQLAGASLPEAQTDPVGTGDFAELLAWVDREIEQETAQARNEK